MLSRLNQAAAGMAGTFGYDAKHYAVSMKMGELSFTACRADRKGQDAHRRRRHQLPHADLRRDEPHGNASGRSAGGIDGDNGQAFMSARRAFGASTKVVVLFCLVHFARSPAPRHR